MVKPFSDGRMGYAAYFSSIQHYPENINNSRWKEYVFSPFSGKFVEITAFGETGRYKP